MTHIGRVTLFVRDPDRACAFDADPLGIEARQDAQMGPGGGRWLEDAPPGAQTALALYRPAPALPGGSRYAPAESRIGTFAPRVLEVDDLAVTAQALIARGAAFADLPARRPYGWRTTVRDPDTATIGLHRG